MCVYLYLLRAFVCICVYLCVFVCILVWYLIPILLYTCMHMCACALLSGTTVEFQQPGSFQPLTDMVGGGPFHLEAGQVNK